MPRTFDPSKRGSYSNFFRMYCNFMGRQENSSDILFEDARCIIFKSLSPIAPVHFVSIPKRPLCSLADASEDDEQILGHVMAQGARTAREQGCVNGYRVVINSGGDAGEGLIYHLHYHFIGGEPVKWKIDV